MRRALILPAVVVLAVPFVAGYLLSRSDRATSPVAIPAAVDEVREALAARYYRPLSANVLRLGSVDAMLSALRDPYTSYLTPTGYKLVQRDTAATYPGIGVDVLPTARGLVVVSVQPGPAQRAGVQRGDMIVAIGGDRVAGVDAAKALAQVGSTAPGEPVQLELLRGGRTVHLSVEHGLIHATAVESRLLSFAGVRWGDVRVLSFRSGVGFVVAEQVERLQHQGAHGLVLDLRGDPGGLLGQAVSVTSDFLDRGIVVSLSGAHHVHEVLRAHGGAVTRLPLVVLVDRYTASSAEIVAAALAEHGRATLVGERTFGKGVVQAVDPFGDGSALILTVARYFTPNGESIDHVGVRPQLRAVDDPRTPRDEAIATALRVLAQPAS
jgi:carboxyl-terminal processing protease